MAMTEWLGVARQTCGSRDLTARTGSCPDEPSAEEPVPRSGTHLTGSRAPRVLLTEDELDLQRVREC